MNCAKVKSWRKTVGLERIVSRPQGTWKWQDAFAVSSYRLKRGCKGKKLLWKHCYRGPKMSFPQIKREYTRLPKIGGLHNVEITIDTCLEYLDEAVIDGVISHEKAKRYWHLAAILVRGFPPVPLGI